MSQPAVLAPTARIPGCSFGLGAGFPLGRGTEVLPSLCPTRRKSQQLKIGLFSFASVEQ